MKARFYILFPILLAALSLKGKTGNVLHAQDTVSEQTETIQNIRNANDYLNARTASLEQYTHHVAHIQKQLLVKLNHEEEHNLNGLPATKDSLTAYPYHRHSIDFDSIQRLAANPSSLYNKGSPETNKLIDSLKGIQTFIQKQSGRLQQAADLTSKAALTGDYSAKLQQLQQQLNAQQQLQQLIDQRSQELQQLLPGENIQALSRIQKQIAIAKSKTQSWKQIADDPDATEEKAYEYLQGIQGFNNYLNTGNQAFGGLGNNPSVADLERMGYQTKGMVGQAMQQQFGANLGNVQQQMGKQLQAYQEALSKVKSEADEAQSLYGDTKNKALTLGHSLKAEKPAFKNPMRGIPFLLRWQPQFNFQTTRAIDEQPALLTLSAGLAYKETPKLKMGLGMAMDIGMGKDWQHLSLSYEGIRLRAFADYELLFGIALEGGYERIFRPADRPYLQDTEEAPSNSEANSDVIREAFGAQQQAAYLGLMKSYRINEKWNGTFMIGYNFLWQRYGLRTPVLVQIGWEK